MDFFCNFNLYFEFLNLLYLGDNGAYFLGFFYSFLLILIYNNNPLISPYFIILLLWYPGFENLFSIIRKKILKNSPLLPDPKHLHQLMFAYVNKNLFKKKIYANLLVANIINIYNLFIFSFSMINISDTKFQLLLIFINISIYTLIYLTLFNVLKKINSLS